MADDVPNFPRGVWIAGIVGSLVGMALFGIVPKGYGLGVPCLCFYNAIHGLLTGGITWAGGAWGHRVFSTRRDDPGKYWLAVVAYLLVGGWFLKELNAQ